MAMPNSTSGQQVVDPRKPLLHLLSTHGHNVNYKDDDDMENTAFSFVAAIGNVEAADILLKKNARLPSIRGRDDVTPLYLSVLNGKRDMGFYLFAQSQHMLQEHDWITVYLTSISSRLYDLALEMLTKRESLASARGVEDSETGLETGELCRDTPIFRLMKRMLDILITSQDLERREVVTEATEATLIAVETGNFDFVSTIMRVYPDLDLVYKLNDKG
ncbi:hypothetical protein P8452_14338 [Trifolium repens]|nr:hypothetical protein P8452_14338 [Trifolium repens]